MHRIAILAILAAALLVPLAAVAEDDKVVPQVFGSQNPNLPEFIRYAETVQVGDMLYLSGVTGTPVERCRRRGVDRQLRQHLR